MYAQMLQNFERTRTTVIISISKLLPFLMKNASWPYLKMIFSLSSRKWIGLIKNWLIYMEIGKWNLEML